MRNRASGFCYVADIVLGIMHLAKNGQPKSTRQKSSPPTHVPTEQNDSRGTEVIIPTEESEVTEDDKGDVDQAIPPSVERLPAVSMQSKPRKPRIMYLDLDVHEGDGVHQAFLSPTHFSPTPSTQSKRPPRIPQILTLSIHHHSRTFFPPHKPFSGLPSPSTPHPFTLSIPLHAYPGPSTYATIWSSVVRVKEAFDPDYVVLQLGVDGLPGDRVGQYGAWSVHGEGGVGWCVQQVKEWGVPLVVLGGGGYDSANAARAWAVATSVLVGLTPSAHGDFS